MKKIYQIGTRQEFTYTPFKFFKKNIKTEQHWLIRNVKYIYAEDALDAKTKYQNWFYKEYKGITSGWGDWHLYSDGVNIMMEESYINIVSTHIDIIDKDRHINVNCETIAKNMQAENFKEWWFSEVNK